MSKSEQSARVLDRLGDTQLSVRRHADGLGQDILVQATPLGEYLARFLAAMDGGEPGVEQVAGRQVHVVSHGPDLDQYLVQLIDLLIDLRWAHPRLVQLEFILSEAEGPGMSDAGEWE
jgi:hypothetical protein